MRLIWILVLAMISFAVAGGPGKTGRLVGHVDIGPLSPVERPGVKPKVPPEMYAALSIRITQPTASPTEDRAWHQQALKPSSPATTKTVKLTSTGDFTIDLAPGTYTVAVVSNKEHAFMHLPQEKVVIRAGRITKVNLKVDTGIR